MTLPTAQIDITADEAELLLTVFDRAMGDDAGRLPIYQNIQLAATQLWVATISGNGPKNPTQPTSIGAIYRCRGCGHECSDPDADMAYLNKAGCVSCCSNRRMELI